MTPRSIVAVVAACIACNCLIAAKQTERTGRSSTTDSANLKVILLGTAGGPTINVAREGISTLVVAGSEMLLFDCGRGLTTSLAKLSINPSDVTKIFITHLHSDHVVSLPELYLYPWASMGRKTPMRLWGPDGTRAMMKHLQEAFAFDIHIRRDVDEKYPAEGIRAIATDVREGPIYDANGVKVTAFFVDHGPVKPALGYRVDYRGHSVVMSGDTKPSDNLVKFSQGVDLLIHEVGPFKDDPVFDGPLDALMPNGITRRQAKIIADHHTDAREAALIFQRVKPKLALFSHGNPLPAETLAAVRRTYSGPVEWGDDLMTIEVGDEVTVRQFTGGTR